jgi:hypothetical protein
MGEEPAKAEPERYRAFISYSHGDANFAHWLHRKLESWRLPDKNRLTPVFIDRAELAAGSDLSAQVREALGQSAALVVVCSPNARASRWVGQEIALVRALHPDRPVLAALIDGEPGEAFPDPLLGTGDAPLEPLAADFRKGHDGQRLGLLKLAAGLTKLPLDRLVQRDAAARQRRVMGITAAAVALSLVLSGLLVFAVRQRNEAQRQRAEAEGMVEFMLTDLRYKLKGVGRLDVMDAVNERAMAHYAGEDISRLPDEEALRRAKVLQAIAEDDLKLGPQLQRGIGEARAAWKVTNSVFNRNPRNTNAIFGHAQSEYYLGYSEFLRRRDDPQKYISATLVHWKRYHDLISSLVKISPEKSEWLRELGFAQGNLCTAYLSAPAQPLKAIEFCKASRESFEELKRRNPNGLDSTIELSNRLAWEADAYAALARPVDALAIRTEQLELSTNATRRFPKDARAIEALMLAELGLAQVERTLGRSSESKRHARSAATHSQTLHKIDPNHPDWNWWRGEIGKLLN